MLTRLHVTPRAVALDTGSDFYADQAAAAADLARQRYERAMIHEAFMMAAGHSSAAPHIEHIRLLCELVARHHASRPTHIPF